MNESNYLRLPPELEAIEAETKFIGFAMGSERKAGALLRTLAASKPAARILELGTGTGISTAWLLDGMDVDSFLTTVDSNADCVAIAKRHLGQDRRVAFHVAEGSAFLAGLAGKQFDLIFADTWPGKFHDLELALSLLKPGGFYVIDDLLPQPNWPAEHAPKVPRLVQTLFEYDELMICPMAWSSGLLVATRKPAGSPEALTESTHKASLSFDKNY
jgi:predicted O-methyltransferase YrrM